MKLKIVAVICVVWCHVVVNSVNAEDYSEYVKEGSYIGVSFMHNSMIDGDFKDSVAYVNEAGTRIWSVPDVGNGMGFSIVYGVRTDIGAFELGYQRTFHDANTVLSLIGDTKANYNVVDFNFKYNVLAYKQFRPYLLIGAGIPWLEIEDGQIDNNTDLDDEIFYGLAGNVGAGVAYYVTPQWAVTVGAIFRWNWLPEVDQGSLSEDLFQKTLGLSVGVAYTF